VVDTGLSPLNGLTRNAMGDHRVLAQYDAIVDRENASAPKRLWDNDSNGHGTHVVSVTMSARASCRGKFNGIAPGADLVSIRALDENGAGRYIDVIRGIGWAVEHRSQYGIRVLSLAFSAVPQSRYWDDPVNQAAMRAWQRESSSSVRGQPGPGP
jgi:serine protease AprX